MPFHRLLSRVADALYAFRKHKRAILEAGLWTLVGHAALLLGFAAAGTVLVPESPALVTGFLGGLGMLANALPLTPAGLGVGETAFDRLFALVGVTGGATLPLAWRVGSLPLGLLGCVFYAVGVKARRPHPVRAADTASVASLAQVGTLSPVDGNALCVEGAPSCD